MQQLIKYVRLKINKKVAVSVAMAATSGLFGLYSRAALLFWACSKLLLLVAVSSLFHLEIVFHLL